MWDKKIFLKNIDYLVEAHCGGVQKNFNTMINSRDIVTKWKTTELRPTVIILLKISKIFNVSIDWLLTGKDIEIVDEKKCSINCDERIMDLCRKVKEVVESDSHWGKSLEANIHSFKSGLDNDKDIKELKKSIRGHFAERPRKNTGKKRVM